MWNQRIGAACAARIADTLETLMLRRFLSAGATAKRAADTARDLPLFAEFEIDVERLPFEAEVKHIKPVANGADIVQDKPLGHL